MGHNADSPFNDRELGMGQPITRRDLLNGIALVAGTPLSKYLAGFETKSGSADGGPNYYPPALTGMRGSHDGTYEAAHALRDGTMAPMGSAAKIQETYDLVVVGGGISGLAAAHYFRSRTGTSSRVLVLENHDDFGGHATRNEFRVNGRLLLANGGTYAIESPTPYSGTARELLEELGIHPRELQQKCTDSRVYKHLSTGFFFDKETFGADRLVSPLPSSISEEAEANSAAHVWAKFLDESPFSDVARKDIARLELDRVDYYSEMSQADKKRRLCRISYRRFLLDVVKIGPQSLPFYQTRTHDLFGVGIDAVSALDCWALGFPGFTGMRLDRVPSPGLGYTALGEVTKREPYEFHYPDGNASIARLLVRSLIPSSAPGRTAEDIVLAKVDYKRLDRDDWPVRIRLNSTAVSVKHLGSPETASEVEVQYMREKQLFAVRAKSVVLACWNMMIPYLCPSLPPSQKEALHYGVKVPLVYTVVALRDWKPFQKLGVQRIKTPGMYHSAMHLDEAVNIGGYRSPKSPGEPVLLRMLRTPCKPGLSERDQHRLGRVDLLNTTFDTFERNIRVQLARVLGRAGFEPARDIQAITINRWPHGYAYEYNSLFDPEWADGQRPCEIARRQFGRITIANSDAAAAAYTDRAIDEAYRAVNEILSV